ncbi:PIN domain nuclease, a component of toxin-antitoxin system (PIN domain) [Eubacterium ruminantium]|nr:PIN domain nuclease, a component of toxin-antitoxin system (PIN domain) [Eubacterium ruminantium]
MHILLDTHILLWAMYDSAQLSEQSKDILTDDNNIFYYSHASIWEVSIKNTVGKLEVVASDFMNDCELMGFHQLPILKEHILFVDKLQLNHRDTFDRLLISQAEVENYRFLTEDKKIQKYDNKSIIKL